MQQQQQPTDTDFKFEDDDSNIWTRGLVLRPVGIGRLWECLNETALFVGKPIGDLRVLDLSAGTGTYSSLLAATCRVTATETTVDRVRNLCHIIGGRINECRICAPADTKLANDSFDVAIVHSALMFQSEKVASDILVEVYRLLIPGGQLFVVNVDPIQAEVGYWHSSVLQDAANRAAQAALSNMAILRLAELSGFNVNALKKCKKTLLAASLYNDPSILLASWYRQADIICKFATPAEIETLCSFITTTADKLHEEFEIRDRPRKLVGQCTILTFSLPVKHKYLHAYHCSL